MAKVKYKINPQPTLRKLLEWVREDVREMDWDKVASDKHTVLVPKADVLQIINDWIAYCVEEWPPIKRYRHKRVK